MSHVLHEDIQISALILPDQNRAAERLELSQRRALEEQKAEHRKEKDTLLATQRTQLAHAEKCLGNLDPVDIPLLLSTHEKYQDSMNARQKTEREAYYFQLRQEYVEHIQRTIAGNFSNSSVHLPGELLTHGRCRALLYYHFFNSEKVVVFFFARVRIYTQKNYIQSFCKHIDEIFAFCAEKWKFLFCEKMKNDVYYKIYSLTQFFMQYPLYHYRSSEELEKEPFSKRFFEIRQYFSQHLEQFPDEETQYIYDQAIQFLELMEQEVSLFQNARFYQYCFEQMYQVPSLKGDEIISKKYGHGVHHYRLQALKRIFDAYHNGKGDFLLDQEEKGIKSTQEYIGVIWDMIQKTITEDQKQYGNTKFYLQCKKRLEEIVTRENKMAKRISNNTLASSITLVGQVKQELEEVVKQYDAHKTAYIRKHIQSLSDEE